MELKNRSFQYGKVALAVRTQKHQLQFVLTMAAICTDTRVVEHATVKLLSQWCSGRSNATPRWNTVSSGRRRESCYGRRVAGTRPTPHSPRDLGQGYWAATATGMKSDVCETKTPRCHQLGELEHCPVGKWRSLLLGCYGTTCRQKVLTEQDVMV